MVFWETISIWWDSCVKLARKYIQKKVETKVYFGTNLHNGANKFQNCNIFNTKSFVPQKLPLKFLIFISRNFSFSNLTKNKLMHAKPEQISFLSQRWLNRTTLHTSRRGQINKNYHWRFKVLMSRLVQMMGGSDGHDQGILSCILG